MQNFWNLLLIPLTIAFLTKISIFLFSDALRVEPVAFANTPPETRGLHPLKNLHYCPKCHRGFTLKHNRNRHLKYECMQPPSFKCPYCPLKTKQTSQIYRHIRNRHVGQRVYYIDLKT